MRRLEERTGPFAEMGRLQKALAISGVIRRAYKPITQEVLDALPTQSHEWWVSVARAAKCNPPSPATVESVIGLLAQEIGSHDHPDDVLEGLPKP